MEELLKKMIDNIDPLSEIQKIASAVTNDLEKDPWFMKVFDDIAKVHPFVQGDAIPCLLVAPRLRSQKQRRSQRSRFATR
jgi:hypothetical protein